MNTGKSELLALLQKSSEKLETARILFENARYDDAASRAYYAAFHAMTAALLSKGFSFSSHGQVIGVFNREFIKTGTFPRDFSTIVQALFDDRQTGDYGIFVKIAKSAACIHIDNAARLIESVRTYLGIPQK